MQRHSARHVRNKSFHPPPESLSDDLTTDHHLVLTRNQGLTSNKTFGCVRIGSNLINFGFLWFSESVYKPDCLNGMAPNPLMRRPHGIPELVIFWEHRNIGSLGTLVHSSEEVSSVNELENPHSGGVFPGSQPPHIPKDKVTRHYISLRVFFGIGTTCLAPPWFDLRWSENLLLQPPALWLRDPWKKVWNLWSLCVQKPGIKSLQTPMVWSASLQLHCSTWPYKNH